MDAEGRVYKRRNSSDYLAEGKGEQDETVGRWKEKIRKLLSESSTEIGFEGVVWLHVTQRTIK